MPLSELQPSSILLAPKPAHAKDRPRQAEVQRQAYVGRSAGPSGHVKTRQDTNGKDRAASSKALATRHANASSPNLNAHRKHRTKEERAKDKADRLAYLKSKPLPPLPGERQRLLSTSFSVSSQASKKPMDGNWGNVSPQMRRLGVEGTFAADEVPKFQNAPKGRVEVERGERVKSVVAVVEGV